MGSRHLRPGSKRKTPRRRQHHQQLHLLDLALQPQPAKQRRDPAGPRHRHAELRRQPTQPAAVHVRAGPDVERTQPRSNLRRRRKRTVRTMNRFVATDVRRWKLACQQISASLSRRLEVTVAAVAMAFINFSAGATTYWVAIDG